MVPGMTERDRHAADAQRLAWLAEATGGPARTTAAPRGRRDGNGSHRRRPTSAWIASRAIGGCAIRHHRLWVQNVLGVLGRGTTATAPCPAPGMAAAGFVRGTVVKRASMAPKAR